MEKSTLKLDLPLESTVTEKDCGRESYKRMKGINFQSSLVVQEQTNFWQVEGLQKNPKKDKEFFDTQVCMDSQGFYSKLNGEVNQVDGGVIKSTTSSEVED